VCLYLFRALAFVLDALRFVDRVLDISLGNMFIFRSSVSCDEYGVASFLVCVMQSVFMSSNLS